MKQILASLAGMLFLASAGGLQAGPPSVGSLKLLSGLYVREKNADFWLLQADGEKLHCTASWGVVDLASEDGEVFRAANWPKAKFKFEKDAQGKATGFKDLEEGKPDIQFTMLEVAASGPTGDATGIWQGKVVVDGKKMPVLLKIEETDFGWRAFLPEKDPIGARISHVGSQDGLWDFELPEQGAMFVGGLSLDGKHLSGTWCQAGTQSVKLERQEAFGDIVWHVPKPTSVLSILQDRVDHAKKSVGIVVGIVDGREVRFISYGKADQDGDRKVDEDSVFEIGSVTKVFTAILLADMVKHDEVSLDDSVSKYLPKPTMAPMRGGKEITLLNLSSQTSGLPRMPDNFKPKDAGNPYADYSVEKMYSFLSRYVLKRDIGAKYEYSNIGVGLLGHILALRMDTGYEALVRTRICEPLGMDDTRITLTESMHKRLATGHNQAGNPVANWDIPTLAGAGALRSTTRDMTKFLTANLGLTQTPLASAMAMTHQARYDTGMPDTEIGLGWHITKKNGTELVWHNGGTGGYRSFIGFDKKKHRGIVVLSNSSNDIDDIGLHWLISDLPPI